MLYKRLTLITFLLTVHWLLLACGPMTIKDEVTQSYIPLQGWVLELRQDVTIPPGRSRVFFQEGRLLYGVNEYKPHCHIIVREITDQAQTVRAGRFTIENVYGRDGEVVMNDLIRLAAVGSTDIMADGGNGNGEGLKIYSYFMRLHSDNQPQVTYLACGGVADYPAFADYPTLQDIHTSIGDYAVLLPPVED
jgi:hypothetical protein